MKKLLALVALLAAVAPAIAADNIPITVGAGTPIRSTDTSAGATGAGPYVNWYTLSTSGAAGTAPVVLYGTAGTAAPNPLTVQGIAAMTPLLVTLTGTNNIATVATLTSITNPVTVTQGAAANLNATVVGTGTFAVQAAPSTAAAWGLGATAAGVPANAAYIGMNVAGNLVGVTGTGTSMNVNCTAGCAGSGGTSSTFGVAFPTVGTAIGVQSGANMIAWPAKAANTVANTDVVPEVAVANAATPGRTANGTNAAGASPVVQPSAPLNFHLIATGTSGDATSVKGSATVLFSCQLGNLSTTTIAYLKVFNKASAPTLGTDVPVKTLIIPAPSAGGGGSNPVFGPGGYALSTGFALAVVTGIADNSSTGVSAATVSINCDYE